MSNIDQLGKAYITNRNSIMTKWRMNLKPISAMEHLTKEKPALKRKLRAIFPRGKKGSEIQGSLIFHTL